jgi:hypothetical protein
VLVGSNPAQVNLLFMTVIVRNVSNQSASLSKLKPS